MLLQNHTHNFLCLLALSDVDNLCIDAILKNYYRDISFPLYVSISMILLVFRNDYNSDNFQIIWLNMSKHLCNAMWLLMAFVQLFLQTYNYLDSDSIKYSENIFAYINV